MTTNTKAYDVIVIGAGFFGIHLALNLVRQGMTVLLVDRNAEPAAAATTNNQARVHNGYHYPRSRSTAESTHQYYARFKADYADCIVHDLVHVYAIARDSLTTQASFEKLCLKIGMPLQTPPEELTNLFNPDFIERSYVVDEACFDAARLQVRLRWELYKQKANLNFKASTEVKKVICHSDFCEVITDERRYVASHVFNCTYAGINHLLRQSNFPLLDLKIELVETCLVTVPDDLSSLAITVMDGPYFSLLPFPSKGLHSFGHVDLSPHLAWRERESCVNPYEFLEQRKLTSRFPLKQLDARKYLPRVSAIEHQSSFYELKTVAVENEIDDGRPVIVHQHSARFASVLGTKLDMVYELEDLLVRTSQPLLNLQQPVIEPLRS